MMVDEEGKNEDNKFEFDSAGETVGYISLDQVCVLALHHGRGGATMGNKWRSDFVLKYEPGEISPWHPCTEGVDQL